jgi:uncharacterized protein DUF6962
MAWNASLTELTTAGSDLLLAGVATWAMGTVLRLHSPEQWKVRIWAGVFGLLALGAALGAVVHGLAWSPAARVRLWAPLFLSLALTVALFVVGAIYDSMGFSASRKALPLLVLVGIAFFAATELENGNFLWFVIYETVAMVMAFGIYGYLALKRRAPGSALMTLGIFLSIVAAAIQATKKLHWGGPVPGNSDTIFHLVQIVAVVLLVMGLRRGLISPVLEAPKVWTS